MNVEAEVIEALTMSGKLPEFPIVADIPKHRPDRFVTVVRTGGGHSDVRDIPLITVHAWDFTRFAAAESANIVAETLKNLAITHNNIARVSIESIYNDPDISGHPRYRITTQIVVHNI